MVGQQHQLLAGKRRRGGQKKRAMGATGLEPKPRVEEKKHYSRSVLSRKEITSVRPSFAEVPKAPATFCRQSDHWILGLRGHFVRNIWP